MNCSPCDALTNLEEDQAEGLFTHRQPLFSILVGLFVFGATWSGGIPSGCIHPKNDDARDACAADVNRSLHVAMYAGPAAVVVTFLCMMAYCKREPLRAALSTGFVGLKETAIACLTAVAGMWSFDRDKMDKQQWVSYQDSIGHPQL